MIVLFGCIPTYKLSRPQLIYGNKKGADPELNTLSTATTGGLMYTEYTYKINPSVMLDDSLHTSYRDVDKNVRLSKMNKDGEAVYGTVSISDQSITYLRDTTNNGSFNQIMVQARHHATNWTDIHPVSYHKVGGVRAESGGYQRDAIYAGIKNDSLTLLYQSYKKDLTTPAFSDTLRYDLRDAETGMITLHGAHIKIINLSTDSISYKVLVGFDESSAK